MMTKKKNELTYEHAFDELSTIVQSIEQDHILLEELSRSIERANELIAFCKGKLRQTEEECKKNIGKLKE